MKKLLYVLIVGAATSCLPDLRTKEKPQAPPEPSKNGVNKTYYSTGQLKSEVPIQDGKRHGLAKEYYADGKTRLEIEYANNRREGMARMYYQDGKPYMETPYVEDKIHGVQKQFRQNGKLSSEATYRNGEPCSGLKEYLVDGSLKKGYPTIVVTPVDNLLREDRYTLRLSMSDGSRTATFYTGKVDDGCLGESLEQIRKSPQKGVAEIEYYLPRGTFIMEELNIVVRLKTSMGNYYIAQRKYNVAIENR